MLMKRLMALLLGITILTACGPKEIKPPSDEVTVQLKWVHQAQFAGYYVAREKGYYAEENINVSFLEGGPNTDLVEQVTEGRADFGVDAPEQLLTGVNRGKPIKAIAVIYRRNPMVFIAMADSGIERPADFLGRSVAILGSDAETQYYAMMKRLDLDQSQVELLPYSYDNAAFFNGEADITIGYATGSLIRIRQAGYNVNLIWPSDYGIHLYADTLFTTDQLIAQNPDLVTRFLRATLRGWREAIENPEEAVTATLKYAREADPQVQTEMMHASLPLIHTGQDQIGWMRTEMWQGMADILLEQAILTGPVDVNQVYTVQFLQQVYGETP